MACRDAFVTEHAANFKHALHAANDEALQVQFECNAQKQLHVERVVVRDEWASMGAAHFHVQHWRFYFNEFLVVQSFPEAGDSCVTNLECTARFFVDDEVGVALAITGVNIGKPMPFVGQRANGFRKQHCCFNFDRQLAFARGHH